MEPKQSVQWYAEITMGKQDYERLDALLRRADELAVYLKGTRLDVEAINPYYAILRQLYGNLRPIMGKEQPSSASKIY